MLQRTATHGNTRQHAATHGNTRQHMAAHGNTLQHIATLCRWKLCITQGHIEKNTLQHTATHCNTLQHTATHCNTLQHTATHCNTLQHTATHCNTLHQTATHCKQSNTLQHTATHCNTLHFFFGHVSEYFFLIDPLSVSRIKIATHIEVSMNGKKKSVTWQKQYMYCVAIRSSVLQCIAVCCSEVWLLFHRIFFCEWYHV